MAHVVIADDNRTTTKTLCTLVERWGHEATQAFNGQEALAALESQGADVLITDLRMPEMDGLELLRRVVDRWPDVVVIVATAYGSIETAVEAMKLGAFDFLTKPYDDKELRAKVEKAVAQREMVLQLERMNARIESFEADSRPGVGEIIGTSPAMGRVFEQVSKVGRPTPRCCCWARVERGRSWWRGRFTIRAPGVTGPSCPPTVPPLPKVCSRASSLAMRRGRSPGQ